MDSPEPDDPAAAADGSADSDPAAGADRRAVSDPAAGADRSVVSDPGAAADRGVGDVPVGESDRSVVSDPGAAADRGVGDVPVSESDRGAQDGGTTDRGGLSWGRVAVLGLALTFLGFALGYVATGDRPPSADSVDVGFLQDMLTHHDQAIGVATLTVAYGEDPVVRSFAREVLTFQSYEIGVMTQMLDQWGFSRGGRSDEAMAWMDMAVPVDEMPGLLTPDQLDQVQAARGAALDSLFLDLMAEHHRGGLHMAQEAADGAEDDDVAALAARMERNQAGEINEYRLTAETLGLDIEIEPASVPAAGSPPRSD